MQATAPAAYESETGWTVATLLGAGVDPVSLGTAMVGVVSRGLARDY